MVTHVKGRIFRSAMPLHCTSVLCGLSMTAEFLVEINLGCCRRVSCVAVSHTFLRPLIRLTVPLYVKATVVKSKTLCFVTVTVIFKTKTNTLRFSKQD